MRRALFHLILLALLLAGSGACFVNGAEVIPPKPQRYFNDYANATSVQVQQELDRALENLEKTDSTQIVVAIYPKMQSDSDIAEYTTRVAQSWGAGTKEKDNGAVLFVFIQDRKMYLQVGYGLEGAIPDITAKDITENRIKPHFRNGDYNAGLRAGVASIIQAARGEYQGTGRTAAGRGGNSPLGFWPFLVFFFVFWVVARTARKRGFQGGPWHGSRRRGGWGTGPIVWTSGGSGRGWGGGGGGGWSGGFSGGGGSFGGGGAGSSW